MRETRTPANLTRQHGFSMLEILITLVIVAIALLGTAGLQLYAMRMNHGAQLRTQAIFLASDIAERMEANKTAAIAGNYAVAPASAPGAAASDCAAAACSGTALAGFDISQWEASVVGLLPQAAWAITQTVVGNPSTYTILIQWVDRSTDRAGHGEAFSYTATRTIGN